MRAIEGRARTSAAKRLAVAIVLAVAVVTTGAAPQRPSAGGRAPDILLITIDTLRADHLSAYGYERPTSPNLDALLAGGVKFDEARTIEPLTSPSMCSLVTGLMPHRHGSSRNGLRMRPGLASLPKELRYRGYETAAFVGNWTLRDKMSGLAEHFDVYEEVLTRRRYFGLVLGEATAEDLNDAALGWLRDRSRSDRPAFLWVHYSEPHGPYRLWKEYKGRLGLEGARDIGPIDRYDTEIAFVDNAIGNLLTTIDDRSLLGDDPMIVFASDHGESLGEHGYWGHGRHLYEPSLHIPMGIHWSGRVAPRTVAAPALITDLAPTILGLLGSETMPEGFSGFDWSRVMRGESKPPEGRVTRYQAHRGAVMSRHRSDLARRSGLLEVGLIDGDLKEIFRVGKQHRRLYDLANDPGELDNRAGLKSNPTEALDSWMRSVYAGLTSFEDVPPEPLDEESVAKLRSLGYIE